MNSEPEPKPSALTFEHIVETATEHVLAQGGYPPTLILEGENETVSIDLNLPDDAERRLEQMYVLGIRIGRTKSIGTLRQAFLISEAWNSHAEPGQTEILAPSDDAKRRELLLIAGIRLTPRHSQMTVLEMHRDAQGGVRELTDLSADLGIDESQSSPQLNLLVSGYRQGKASMTGMESGRSR